MEEDVASILISADELQAKVRELGQAISRDYAGLDPLLVGVLKGVVVFMADLLRAITIPVSVDFLAISSYGPQAASLGIVRIIKDLDQDIHGRHVLLVEDVVDTGLTLSYILKTLQARQPASLNVCTLFNRPHRRLVDVPIVYKGFDLPDCFVVGYGLDYEQRYRNLPYVAVLKDEILGIRQRCS
ncbi:MAG: hypoxanthine phosphoribosyltransferase [Acidobacteriota bacterium]|nr:hypoxanthine phosphoribosyltransferase [Acidobacteriota bacterium]